MKCGYPILEIDTKILSQNARILRELCLKCGVEPAAVIKGFNACPAMVEVLVKAGYRQLASSRLCHLEAVKRAGYHVETCALRIPMFSEIPELVRWADISLESEEETLREIDREAKFQGRIHKVILMRDLGDLREGCILPDKLYHLAEVVEKELPSLHLYGIGTNLTCYGSVVPTEENLTELIKNAIEIERRISRKLEIISGGSTSSLPLAASGKLPERINHLRIGEALAVPCDLIGHWNTPIPGLSNKGLILKAQIIEYGCKPTHPIGALGLNGLGEEVKYEDRGIRKRALLALGVLDVGDLQMLIPVEPGIQVLGGSSDHLIVDMEECEKEYGIGDWIEFELHYKSMMFATLSPMVAKIQVR